MPLVAEPSCIWRPVRTFLSPLGTELPSSSLRCSGCIYSWIHVSVLGVAISTVSTPLRKISTVGCHEVELLGRVGTSSDLHRVVIKHKSLKPTPSFDPFRQLCRPYSPAAAHSWLQVAGRDATWKWRLWQHRRVGEGTLGGRTYIVDPNIAHVTNRLREDRSDHWRPWCPRAL